jgi:hypothetical protein
MLIYTPNEIGFLMRGVRESDSMTVNISRDATLESEQQQSDVTILVRRRCTPGVNRTAHRLQNKNRRQLPTPKL